MKYFLDDDNDFGNQSGNRFPFTDKQGVVSGAGLYDDTAQDEDLDLDDFDDDEAATNDGEFDSEFDSDLESESTDDNNF